MEKQFAKKKVEEYVINSHLRTSLHVKYSLFYCSSTVFILKRRLS